MNILYVEDDPFDAELTQRWCTRQAPHITLDIVDTVAAARQHLQAHAASPYALILADMRLPDGDGLAVLSLVHELALDVPVVLITGAGDEHTVVAALKAGATDYVVKRVGYLERLPTTLENAVRRYRTEAARRSGPFEILYAEPDVADAELTQRHLLRMAPHLRLSSVTTGQEVLQRLSSAAAPHSVDVLLLDYRLPGMDALELAKELWEVRNVDVPIVLVTGKGSEDAAVQALRMGASEYIIKEPGYLERLPWILEQAVTRAALVREQARLKASVQQFETFMNNSLTAATIRDAQGHLLYANTTFLRAFGVLEHDWRGHPLEAVHALERATRLRSYDRAILASGNPHVIEETFPQADGLHDWLLAKFPLTDATGAQLVGTVGVDITERQRAQAEVERRAQQLHSHTTALARLSRSSTLEELGIEATLQEIVQVAAHTLGTARASIWLYDESQQKLVCRVLYEQTPDCYSSGVELLAIHYPAYFRALEATRVIAAHDAHTDTRTHEFSATYLTPLGIAAMLDAPIRVFGRNVGVVCHEHVGTPRTWSQEEETFAASIADFVSMALEAEERRQSEEAKLKLEEQLRQVQKMESLGTLAGGIAHDFNNILTGIFGHISLASLELEPEHPLQARLTAMLTAGERARDLVQQILTFSRQRQQQRQIIRLQDAIEEALALLRTTLPVTIALQVHLNPDAPTVLADPTQVHQVIMNLCTNAAQAIGDQEGVITLEQQTLEATLVLAKAHAELRVGTHYVQLTVRDTGPGIDALTLEHIFDPFFTTKAPGQGTGLGLAVVHGIMKSHDGVVTVASDLGEGTTFALFFPVVEDATTRPTAAAVHTAQGTGQHVLLLDDAEIVLLGQYMLEKLGYRVTTYTNAAEALQHVRQTPQHFDLVISDWTMPGLNGLSVARQVRELCQQLPFVLVTGYSRALDAAEMQEHGIAALLYKPFTLESLGKAITQALASRLH